MSSEQSQDTTHTVMVETAAEVLAKLLVRASASPALLEHAEALQVLELGTFQAGLLSSSSLSFWVIRTTALGCVLWHLLGKKVVLHELVHS